MKYTWIAAATVAVSLLTACGGGGDSATSEPGVPVTSTTQTLDASGGTVTLQGLSLAVPAAALSEPTELGLQQETVASPALARFRFSPAGQVLSTPAELRYSAPDLPANVRFFWEVDGEQWMIPGSVSGNVLTSQVTSLGYTAAGTVLQAQAKAQAASLTERVQAAAARVLPQADSASEGGSVVVQPVDCDTHITVLKTRLARAATDGDQSRAVGIFQDLHATREACAAVRLEELQQASCDALAVAQSKAEVLVADSVSTFKELTVPLYTAQAFVQTTGATCSNANEAANPALVEAKFDQLLDVMKGQMTRAEFDDTLTVRDLGVVMHLDVMCQQLGLDAICSRLSSELYPDVLDALRASAFAACTNGSPLEMGQFYALGSRAGDPDNFFFHGRFSLAAVEADLNYCSNPSLGLRVFDGEAVPGELTDRATTLNPLVSMGNYAKQTTIEVPRDGSLNIAGTVGVLRCPDGSASGADLVFRVNGQEWVRRAASGNAYPLESAPLLLDLPKVLPGFGIDPATSTGFTVTVNREGGACSDGSKAVLDTPFTLFEVQVNLPAISAAVKDRSIYIASYPYDDDRDRPSVSRDSGAFGAGAFTGAVGVGSGRASSVIDTVAANGGTLKGEVTCGDSDGAAYAAFVFLSVDKPRVLSVEATLRATQGGEVAPSVRGMLLLSGGPKNNPSILSFSVEPTKDQLLLDRRLERTEIVLQPGSYSLRLTLEGQVCMTADSVVGSVKFSVAP